MKLIKDIIWNIIWYCQHFRLGTVGNNSKIHPAANLGGYTQNIYLGNNAEIRANATLLCENSASRIVIGAYTVINSYVMVLTYGGNVSIGNYCSINPFTVLYGHGGLEIGNNVLIAAHTTVIPANHIFTSCDLPIREQGLTRKGIVIEDDVWIGTGAKILDGITIGKGSVIGAGTVLTKSVEPYSVVVGVPGRVVRKRG